MSMSAPRNRGFNLYPLFSVFLLCFVFNCLVSLIFSSGYVGFFIVFDCLVVKFCVFLIDFDIWVCGFSFISCIGM
jgi:hypothetical protein